jgi:hypothetical protein
MINVNNVDVSRLTASEYPTDSLVLQGLLRQLQKYNTTVTLELEEYSPAPILIRDANVSEGCEVAGDCTFPDVLKNSTIQMGENCSLCLMDLKPSVYQMYGINRYNPEPTQAFILEKEKSQAVALAFSAMKTYWLGDTTLVAADLRNADLLKAYKKDNGQWKKITETTPPTVTITQNSAVTKAGQMAMTYEQALAYLDAVIDNQSIELQMISDEEKIGKLTVEIFDIIQKERQKNDFAGIRFVPVETMGDSFSSFVYRDIQFIKYEHLTYALRDFTTGVADTYLLPHRIILTVGLPMASFPVPTENTFNTEFDKVSRSFKCSTLINVNHPDAVHPNYYSIAY